MQQQQYASSSSSSSSSSPGSPSAANAAYVSPHPPGFPGEHEAMMRMGHPMFCPIHGPAMMGPPHPVFNQHPHHMPIGRPMVFLGPPPAAYPSPERGEPIRPVWGEVPPTLAGRVRAAVDEVALGHMAVRGAMQQLYQSMGQELLAKDAYFESCRNRIQVDGQRAARALVDMVAELQGVVRSAAFEARCGGGWDGKGRELEAARAEAAKAREEAAFLSQTVLELREKGGAGVEELRDHVARLLADFKALGEQYGELREDHARLQAEHAENQSGREDAERRVEQLAARIERLARRNNDLQRVAEEAVGKARSGMKEEVARLRASEALLAEQIGPMFEKLRSFMTGAMHTMGRAEAFEKDVARLKAEAVRSAQRYDALERERTAAEAQLRADVLQAQARADAMALELRRLEQGIPEQELDAARVSELRARLQLERAGRVVSKLLRPELEALGVELAGFREAWVSSAMTTKDMVDGTVSLVALPSVPSNAAVTSPILDDDQDDEETRRMVQEALHGLKKDVRKKLTKQLVRAQKAIAKMEELEGEVLQRGRDLATVSAELQVLSRVGKRQIREIEFLKGRNAVLEHEIDALRSGRALQEAQERLAILASAVCHRVARASALSPAEEFSVLGYDPEVLPAQFGDVYRFLLVELKAGWVRPDGVTVEDLGRLFAGAGDDALLVGCAPRRAIMDQDGGVVAVSSGGGLPVVIAQSWAVGRDGVSASAVDIGKAFANIGVACLMASTEEPAAESDDDNEIISPGAAAEAMAAAASAGKKKAGGNRKKGGYGK